MLARMCLVAEFILTVSAQVDTECTRTLNCLLKLSGELQIDNDCSRFRR